MELPDDAEDGPVEVWNYPNAAAAEVGKYKLELNGIESQIFGTIVDSYFLTAIGGISLRVKKSEYGAAKAILEREAEVAESIVAPKDEISDAAPFCPDCHSLAVRRKRIRPIPGGNRWVDAWKRRFGLRYLWGCRNCGRRWRAWWDG